jgi:DNA-binding ferritin-like protein
VKRPPHAPQDPSAPSLTDAAAALDAELRRFEELSLTAGKVPLNSQKSIERAATLTREANESRERFAELLKSLVAAVSVARDRQQTSADALQTRVDEIQSRTACYEGLLQRFAGLGSRASSLQERVLQAAAMQKSADGAVASTGVASVLEEVQDRLAEIITEAADLARAANSDDFADLARQADSLRQQVLSVRNRVGLLQRNLKTN